MQDHPKNERVAVFIFKYRFLWLQMPCLAFCFLFFLCEMSTFIVLQQILSPAFIWLILQISLGGRGPQCRLPHVLLKGHCVPWCIVRKPSIDFKILNMIYHPGYHLSPAYSLTSSRLLPALLNMTYHPAGVLAPQWYPASSPQCFHMCCLRLPGTAFPTLFYLTAAHLQMSF